MGDPHVPTLHEVEAALARAYASPELSRHLDEEAALTAGLRERLVAWLDELFGQIPGVSPGTGTAAFLSWTLIIGVTLIIGWVFFRALLRWIEARPERSAESGPTDRPARDASYWLALAHERREAGRYRDALAALYQALIQRLDSSGKLRYDPAKTPGDYRAEVNATARPGLERFLTEYEPVVFGGVATDERRLRELESLIPGVDHD